MLFPIASQIATGLDLGTRGSAGNINLKSRSLSVTNQGVLTSSTSGIGDAGNIKIYSPDFVTIGNNSQLTVETRSEGQAGNIVITSDTISVGQDARLSATATETATNTQGGGSINLNTRNLNIAGQLGIFAETQSSTPAGSLTINPNNNNLNLNIRFTDNGFISARTFDAGEGGDIVISAPQTIDIQGQGQITAEALGSGNAGEIDITTHNLTLAEGLEISASTIGDGNAGNINLNANQHTLNNTTINSFTDGNGNAGSIQISNQGNNAQSINLNNNSRISTEIQNNGNSDPNSPSNITLQTDNLIINNSQISTAIEAEGNQKGKGTAGSIIVPNAQTINLNTSEISASTSGEGDTGQISLNANQKLQLNNSQINSAVESNAIGNSQQITINTPDLELKNSEISAATAGKGNAGSITVPNAQTINLDTSTISTEILPTGIATQPSNITLNSQQLNLQNNSQINASTQGQGNAGNIAVSNAEKVALDHSSQINASTDGQGNAGDIGINAATVTLDNNSEISTTIGSNGIGKGGNITLKTSSNSLFLNNLSEISSRSQGQGDAGNISIDSRGAVILNNSDITTSSDQASGGEININASTIQLRGDSDIRTNVNNGAGGGGDINLFAEAILVFDDSDILAFARDGEGGNITLNTPVFFGDGFQQVSSDINVDNLDGNNRVDVNASGAISGLIIVPDLNFIRNSLTELPQDIVDTDNLIANSCVVPNRSQTGTFIITGSGGLPVRPGDVSSSTYSTGEVRTLEGKENSNGSWQPENSIIEPQGVYRLPSGKLVLSRECDN